MEKLASVVEKNKKILEAMEHYVRPDTFPLAIRVMKEGEELPERVKRPFKDIGEKFSICQSITMSRRYGWALAMGAEDQSCPIARIVFGFAPEVDYYKEGNIAHGMYAKTCDIGAVTESVIPKFTQEEAGTILIAPLGRANFEPELILTYGNAAQVMRMVAAALYNGGGEITSTFTARADCADIIIKTIKSNKPQVILPCNGDRVFAQTHDHEMAFTFPYEMADSFIEGLEGTHKGGVRYPIPSYLHYTNQYPPKYEKLNSMLDEA